MAEIGKTLILLGGMLILIGALLALGGKLPWLGRLPGDIVIQRDNFTFYFPLVTSIVISVILSLLFTFFRR
jgi:membrane protein implicated in regulation of membrane protease activity